ncbi:SIR2 family protein [Shewanella sp. SG44-2]|uniref:SIR2 family NAD-dependent protein deacylase n=1 Tax=Shewanella sp. SG44-2 TaxID=2760962 RepID=UPI001600A98E|nr:SIR2 family protein [Shewanella sp. SG44-2]MBB1427932.1 SIR2 family protein [Shewanella sp. SG44-2]|tara:strand:- start:2888 stop:4795 length:1908 start_codon:yes stop_codon:yes gene_type:complete
MNPNNSFEYIVRQILNRRCIPVAGAGISLYSEHPEGLRYHTVPWMIATLECALLASRVDRFDVNIHGPICSHTTTIDAKDVQQGCLIRLQQLGHSIVSVGTIKSGCFFCDVISAAKNLKLGNLAELFLWEPISNIDDSNNSKAPYKQLIELLRIVEYPKLEPTPAHKIIAKLARESLISEVITTNYDCNFEKAYTKIVGKNSADVIANLNNYRELGATSNGVVNRLKIFKINGCSEELGDGSNEDQCERILLTERQLQQWRNRQWAADIFKDRLRSNTLFFNGFGSDEPQIHHTLQTVLDEYSDYSHTKGIVELFNTPSAPIVAIYDLHPSFHQQQIIKSYAFQHDFPPQDGDKLIIRNPKVGSTLPADELWQAIFERIYRQLLINALEHSIVPANASFTAIVPYASTILGEILSTFEKTLEADKFQDDEKSQITSVPDWLSSLKQICARTILPNSIYQAFSTCLQMLNGHFNEQDEAAHYVPVNENKALMSELMLLLFILHENRKEQISFCQKRGIGISLKDEVKSLYVSASPSFLTDSNTSNEITGAAELILLIGNAGSCTRPQIHRLAKVMGKSTLQPSTIIALGWKHIFYDGRLNGISSINKRLMDAVQSPTHYYYVNQPSLNKRSYLIQV